MRYYASFIDSSATINDVTIHFGTGTHDEELLRVPLAPLGDLTPQSLIRITIGINPPVADGDPYIGISDGVNSNQFQLIEYAVPGNSNINPCEVRNGAYNGRSGPVGNPVAGGYTLLFDPFRHFGSCSTNNGYNTDASFNSQLDITKDFSLVIQRSESHEQYTFHFLLVEFI